MKLDRRSFLRFMLASAAASTMDVEQLLWVPRPMIVVPAIPHGVNSNMGRLVAAAWEEYVGKSLDDNIFNDYWLLSQLRKDIEP